MSVLSKPYFHDETAAVAKLEEIIWPEGPTCPHCGAVDRIYDLKGNSTRIGLKKCGHCRKQFTVKVGTVFESSHVPLHKWFQAAYLLCSSKKGISAHQLHRVLEVTYKTAWFMAHRLREAMTLMPILAENIAKETTVNTDEAGQYVHLGRHFNGHGVVRHGIGEYGRGETHTNTIEGYFSIFKRGMKGVYQHCAKKHLHRYVAEFNFRYNERDASDGERSAIALAGIVGKRLMYRDSSGA